MEEAFAALYQEFLHLQSICLKQAAMLQHLTETLRRQQESGPISNGELDGLVSNPVRCAHESKTLAFPEQKAKTSPSQYAVQQHRADAEVCAIAGGMDRLQLYPKWGEEGLESLDESLSIDFPGRRHAQEPSITDELRQVEQHWRTTQAGKQPQGPWSSSFLNSEILSQAGGMLMSRVTLQSQVCEFCHAVFPGHTSTRGEFLRHLSTHIS